MNNELNFRNFLETSVIQGGKRLNNGSVNSKPLFSIITVIKIVCLTNIYSFYKVIFNIHSIFNSYFSILIKQFLWFSHGSINCFYDWVNKISY